MMKRGRKQPSQNNLNIANKRNPFGEFASSPLLTRSNNKSSKKEARSAFSSTILGFNLRHRGVLLQTIALLVLVSRPKAQTKLAVVAAASRAYPQGCGREPRSYYDYDTYPLPPPGLPSRTHDEFWLLRRLGAGKFSDVFEAVDVGVNDVSEDVMEVDPASLCVIKCLKPVSDRKIRRELLVLSHASRLPNLARLRGVVIPDISSGSTSSSENAEISNSKVQKTASSKLNINVNNGGNHNRIQKFPSSPSSPASTTVPPYTSQMPSLILEHAGPHCRWLCHGRGCDPTQLPPPSTSTPQPSNVKKNFPTKDELQQRQQKQQEMEEAPLHLSEYEMKYYLFHLLVALDALHSRGIMHRDVKPRNVLINRQWPPPTAVTLPIYQSNFQSSNSNHAHSDTVTPILQLPTPPPLMLIDLGLADFYLPNQHYNVRVASRHYKAPELLLGYGYYDYGIDMWGVGCILAGLLLRREPFFRGRDNVDQLGKIVSVLGSRDLLVYCHKCGIELSEDLERVVRKYTVKSNPSGTRKSWLSVLYGGPAAAAAARDSNYISNQGINGEVGNEKKKNNNNLACPVPSESGLDLLDKLLVYDHEIRLTAREAMEHEFFDEVRDIVKSQVQKRWHLEQQQQQQQQQK